MLLLLLHMAWLDSGLPILLPLPLLLLLLLLIYLSRLGCLLLRCALLAISPFLMWRLQLLPIHHALQHLSQRIPRSQAARAHAPAHLAEPRRQGAGWHLCLRLPRRRHQLQPLLAAAAAAFFGPS